MMGPHHALAITVHEREAYLAGETNAERRELPPAEADVLKAIEAKLNWTYEFSDAVKLSAKAAVSRIGHDETDMPAFNEPAFLGKKQSAVFAGTATHAAMQYLPTNAGLGSDGIALYVSSLVKSGRLTQDQADVVDANAVEWFSHTTLFDRMKASVRLERELTFSYAVDASVLYEIDTDEKVLLQGVMDACFLEDGHWVIVDYKTDRVRPGESARQAAQKHERQLELYALALQNLTQIDVKERIVVLLSHRDVISL
jgi:ATP-dependent helicase/nuclease subunit A